MPGGREQNFASLDIALDLLRRPTNVHGQLGILQHLVNILAQAAFAPRTGVSEADLTRVPLAAWAGRRRGWSAIAKGIPRPGYPALAMDEDQNSLPGKAPSCALPRTAQPMAKKDTRCGSAPRPNTHFNSSDLIWTHSWQFVAR